MAHFAPGLLEGDVYVVYVNGRLQLKGVPFKTVSDYLKVKPGKFKVEVREAGEPANSPPVVAATVELEAGKAYTVAVFGQLTSVEAALLTDDMSRPADGKSKFRLIQAIPGESAVDLVTLATCSSPTPSTRRPANIRKSRRARPTSMSARPAPGEVLAKADNVKLASGSISSLVAVGGIGEKMELLDIDDAAAAVSAAGGVATGAGGTATSPGGTATSPGGTATSPSPGGRRFALLLLIGCGLAAATGFVVQQRLVEQLGASGTS